jgi:hypothetical protein
MMTLKERLAKLPKDGKGRWKTQDVLRVAKEIEEDNKTLREILQMMEVNLRKKSVR